jgi:hypothetical protein
MKWRVSNEKSPANCGLLCLMLVVLISMPMLSGCNRPPPPPHALEDAAQAMQNANAGVANVPASDSTNTEPQAPAPTGR